MIEKLSEAFTQIIENSGHINSMAGIIVVFFGLVLISFAITLFNKASHYFQKSGKEKVAPSGEIQAVKTGPLSEKIPNDELVAIATAIEVYRLLHFEILQNEVTFTHGVNQTPWKTIQRNRQPITRTR
ncbi:MAG: OadG family protein [Candidatus Marinimicrobia bacterium]|nr:OadG family protein [Candidatus Neomarinimicrobiota bacterium]